MFTTAQEAILVKFANNLIAYESKIKTTDTAQKSLDILRQQMADEKKANCTVVIKGLQRIESLDNVTKKQIEEKYVWQIVELENTIRTNQPGDFLGWI